MAETITISYETYLRYKDNVILHDEDQWSGRYTTYGEMWEGEGYEVRHEA